MRLLTGSSCCRCRLLHSGKTWLTGIVVWGGLAAAWTHAQLSPSPPRGIEFRGAPNQSATQSLTSAPAPASLNYGIAPPTATPSTVTPSAANPVDASQVVQQGLEYERQGMWADALSLYQQALRAAPQDGQLIQRRSLARIHCDLERRYADTSFVGQVQRSTPALAEGIYAEVLLKIQSYYVDDPNWNEIARCGLTSVKVALESPEFRELHIPNVPAETIVQGFNELAQTLKSARVEQRHDAMRVATESARHLNKTLGLSQQATYFEFVCGAIAALDPYSAFLSDSHYQETMSQIEGNFVGLGVELKTHPDHLELISVIRGGPAAQGGLLAGDRLTHVDGRAVADVGPDKCADMLRGEEGSTVTLNFLRGSQSPQALQLVRRRVDIPSVDLVQMLEPTQGVGYIRLTNFQKTTVRDFDSALWNLQRQGMRSLVIDLRGNPGGLLTAAVEIADRFMSNGIIVATKGRNPLEDFTHRAELAGTWRMPLVVLVDENSASASEILAAAIREQKRGVIVGNQSYGKGSVQGIFPLNISGGGVRLTTAKFYGPSGASINQVGVKPDYEVRVAARPAFDQLTPDTIREDQALQTAISVVAKNEGSENKSLLSQNNR